LTRLRLRLTRRGGWVLSIAGLIVIGGCDSLEASPGARSILQISSGPTPTKAVGWALDEYDPNNRYRGTMYLATQPWGGGPEYLQLYVDAIKDDDAGVRSAGVRGLALHGSPEHVPLILETLVDEDRIVRIDSARALQRIHAPVAVEPLMSAIQVDREESEMVRAEAADALGQYAQPRVVDALIAALSDTNLAVNEATRKSLRTLTGQDFELDTSAWVNWARGREDLFAARSAYIYPAFWRERTIIEYLPFVGQPPIEEPSIPVGFPPAIDQ
jgi:HEAT repeat protein